MDSNQLMLYGPSLQSQAQLIRVNVVVAIMFEVWLEWNQRIFEDKHLAWREWFENVLKIKSSRWCSLFPLFVNYSSNDFCVTSDLLSLLYRLFLFGLLGVCNIEQFFFRLVY